MAPCSCCSSLHMALSCLCSRRRADCASSAASAPPTAAAQARHSHMVSSRCHTKTLIYIVSTCGSWRRVVLLTNSAVPQHSPSAGRGSGWLWWVLTLSWLRHRDGAWRVRAGAAAACGLQTDVPQVHLRLLCLPEACSCQGHRPEATQPTLQQQQCLRGFGVSF